MIETTNKSGFVQPTDKTMQRVIQNDLLGRTINRIKKSAQKRRKREQIVRQELETG